MRVSKLLYFSHTCNFGHTMSVWKSACYKEDAFQFFARNMPPSRTAFYPLRQFLNFETVLDGPLNDAISLTPGNVADQIEDFDVISFASSPGVKASLSLQLVLADVSNFRFGLHAVTTFIHAVWPRLFDHGMGEVEDMTLERDIYLTGLIGGAHTQRDIMARAPIMHESQQKYLVPVQFVNKSLRHVGAAHKSRHHSQETSFAETAGKPLPKVETKLRVLFPLHSFYSHRGAVMIVDKHGPWSLVLLQKDIDRIEKFIVGAANARIYASLYGVLDKSKRNAFTYAVEQWQDLAVGLMGKCDKEEAQWICRTFDVAYFVALAQFAGDLDKEPLNLQLAKYESECLSKKLPLADILRIGANLPFKERLEVFQQYKLFPVSDFDSYSAMQRQEAMYQKYSAVYDGVEYSTHYEGIMKYHRWMMAVAFHHRHGKCPGYVKDGVEEKAWHASYPLVDIHRVPFTDIDDVDFAGEFVYNFRADDCIDLLKDKAICPRGIKYVSNQADLGRLPVSDKSQLVNVLKRSAMPDLNDLRKEVLFYDVKCDDKPEAKKPNGRLFFEAHSDVRLLLSEYEDSNAGYARHMPGCVLGRSTVDTRKIINAASAYASDEHGTVPVYISFDLEKFSPAFNIKVSKDLDAHWAEAYGVPEIADSSKILTEGEIHYVKGNFHHTIPKYGSDFEGFFGRRNTMYHCAVMGYTVHQMKKRALVVHDSHFAALIDDGLLRCFVEKDQAADRTKAVKRCIEEIYANASLTISWDKTFVSNKSCVFLNDVKVFGRTFTPGMKAILRIGNRSDDICPSILSDLQLVASTTRGAVTAGAVPTAAYAMYAIMCGDAIRRWARGKMKTTIIHVFKMFLPARVGGLGLVGLLSLAGSLVHDDFVEALGVLAAVGTRFPSMQQAINRLVNVSITLQTEEAKYSNPSKLRSRDFTVKADRGYQKIKHYLMYNARLPAIENLQEFLKDGDGNKDVLIPAAPPKLAVEIRERIWNSSPYHVIEGIAAKFLKSTSALVFVPRRVLYRAMVANKTEAVAYFSNNKCVADD